MRRLGDLPCGRVIAAVWLAGVLDAAMPVSAKDLGVWGEVWPIEEPDLLTEVETMLENLEASGELARLEGEARARARERLESPPAVPGIVRATESRTWLYDPAVIVREDIVGPAGLIAANGTRIEPLAHRPMTQTLLFIDGTRPGEVQWALSQVAPTRIVLVAGRPLDLARTHARAFYFDQGGVLSDKFGIGATPARIRQEGLKLRIEELPLRGAVLRTADSPLESLNAIQIITDDEESIHDPKR